MRHTIKFLIAVWSFAFATVQAKAAEWVKESDFVSAVREEFSNQGQDGAMDIEFFGGQTTYELKDGDNFKIMISNFDYNSEQNKFSGQAEVFVNGQKFAETDLIGKYFLLTEVYVPARTINKGEIIKSSDLKAEQIREARLKETQVYEKDKLLGKEAKRILKEGKLITSSDVGNKILVHKGDVITAVYKNMKMQITAKVEAMEDGAQGDKIEVKNTKSGKTFHAEVLNAAMVEVDVQ